MNLQKIIGAVIFLNIFNLGVLSAQEKPRKAKVQISCVSWEKLSFSELFYRDGRDFLPLKIRPKNRSKLYPLHRNSIFELYIRELGEDEKMVYKLVGKAPLPEGSNRALFFVDSNKTEGQLPLKVVGIDDSLKAFPPGSFRFVNYTRVPLEVFFNGEKNKVPASEMTVVEFDAPSNGGLLPFYIKTTKGHIVYENRLFSKSTGRDMVFISPPKVKGGRVKIMLLPQVIAPALPVTN